MKLLGIAVVIGALGCGHKSAPVELGSAGHPFGAVADIDLGMTPDQVAAKAPKLTRSGSSFTASSDEATYNVDAKSGHVDEIRIQVFHRSPDELWKAWGPGTILGSQPEEQRRYIDAARKARADVSVFEHGFVVRIGPMVPFASVLDGPDPLAVMGTSLLGHPAAEVTDAFKARGLQSKATPSAGGDGTSTVEVSPVPPTEWTSDGYLLLNVSADGKVYGWSLIVAVDAPHGAQNDVAKQALLGFYDKKWGKPTKVSGASIYPTTPPLTVADDNLVPYVLPGTPTLSPPPSSPPPLAPRN